nr:Uncharacterised protein [Klebsiella pneumoniae]
MKPFSTVENTMNGALVIPKLMCIKFCRVFFSETNKCRHEKTRVVNPTRVWEQGKSS